MTSQNKNTISSHFPGDYDYFPTCCYEHCRVINKNRICIDTAKWRFPQVKAVTHKVSRPILPTATDDLDNELKAENLAKDLKICLDAKLASKVADALGYSKLISDKKLALGADGEKQKGTLGNITSKQKEEIISSDTASNMYSTLIEQIEKNQKEWKKPDPEAIAYKVVEEKLDKCMKDFCEWTSCLALPEDIQKGSIDSSSDSLHPNVVIEPEKLKRMFQVELCQSSLCPYIPYIIREATEMPHQIQERLKTNKIVDFDAVPKAKSKVKQVYYIPVNQWFTPEDEKAKVEFTLEEEAVIKSFPYKKFMTFLKEINEEPPKIFEDIKTRHQEQLKAIKQKKIDHLKKQAGQKF